MLAARRDPVFDHGKDEPGVLRCRPCRRARRFASDRVHPPHRRHADYRHGVGHPARAGQRLFDLPRQFLARGDLRQPCAPASSPCWTRTPTPRPCACWCGATWRRSSAPAARSIPMRSPPSRRCWPSRASGRRDERAEDRRARRLPKTVDKKTVVKAAAPQRSCGQDCRASPSRPPRSPDSKTARGDADWLAAVRHAWWRMRRWCAPKRRKHPKRRVACAPLASSDGRAVAECSASRPSLAAATRRSPMRRRPFRRRSPGRRRR